MHAEAGNEFVSRSRKQGKLPKQITLSTDLNLILLAYLRGTDPNPSEVNGKTPIAIRVPCTEPRDCSEIPCGKHWEQSRDSLRAESRRAEKEADGKLGMFWAQSVN